jgi:beta-carotene ketolase (CrtW type)
LTGTTRRGLLLAAGILLGWLGSWVILLPVSCWAWPPVAVMVAILARTVLQTGLFIVAHDAMHGTLWPNRPAMNRRLGQLALALYGALPYELCLRNHGLHHRHGGDPRDPDVHPPGDLSFWRWYGRFMAAYVSPWQVAGLGLGWLALGAVAAPISATPLENVLLYGALPTLLSSLQLFAVGTYLPHRPVGAVQAPRSLDLPTWLSLLSCYHFGYHWEHHAYPHLAWHELPGARPGAEARAKAGRQLPPALRV